MIFMATSSSSTLLESTASAENGGGSTTLPLGPQVAQQIPFQVRNLRAMVRYPGFYTPVIDTLVHACLHPLPRPSLCVDRLPHNSVALP